MVAFPDGWMGVHLLNGSRVSFNHHPSTINNHEFPWEYNSLSGIPTGGLHARLRLCLPRLPQALRNGSDANPARQKKPQMPALWQQECGAGSRRLFRGDLEE